VTNFIDIAFIVPVLLTLVILAVSGRPKESHKKFISIFAGLLCVLYLVEGFTGLMNISNFYRSIWLFCAIILLGFSNKKP